MEMRDDRGWIRLRPSPIHGIGCFAIRNIPAGTELFPQSSGEMVWIPKRDLINLSPEIAKMYENFCVERGDLVGCPRSFNCMDPSWYPNHSDTPNAFCDPDHEYSLFALQDIAESEEVTLDYNSYAVLDD